MSTRFTADNQRTIVIVLTVIFVLLIVATSLVGLRAATRSGEQASYVPTTISFGPLGNGVATCERRAPKSAESANFVVIYSTEETVEQTYQFQVELTGNNGEVIEVVATAEAITSTRLAELELVSPSGEQSFIDCRITGIQQDKRVLRANP